MTTTHEVRRAIERGLAALREPAPPGVAPAVAERLGLGEGYAEVDGPIGPVFVAFAPPTLSVSDLSVTEGDSGSVNATFTVNLSYASNEAVTVSASSWKMMPTLPRTKMIGRNTHNVVNVDVPTSSDARVLVGIAEVDIRITSVALVGEGVADATVNLLVPDEWDAAAAAGIDLEALLRNWTRAFEESVSRARRTAVDR
jgi:hypothetical protein